MNDITKLVNILCDSLLKHKLYLTVAESCTGGALAAYLTSVPGSSSWFERGFVSYSNSAKQDMLGVSLLLLDEYGAVSEEVVRAMAQGALNNSDADVSIAITGIAGPSGGSLDKPIGTVWIGFAHKEIILSNRYFFTGSRVEIRELAVLAAIKGAIDFIGGF